MRSEWKAPAVVVGVALSLTLASCVDSAPTRSSEPGALGPSASLQKATVGPPSVLQWNATAISLAGQTLLRVAFTNRAYMLLSVAEADALDAAGVGTDESSSTGAVGGAAVTVLTYIFPAEQMNLEAALTLLRSAAADAGRFDAAAAIGRAAAGLVVDHAKTDGSDAVVVPVIPVGPGFWTTSPGAVATPQWSFVRPMLMKSGSQFRPGPPPAFGSAKFLTALQRVRNFSDTRTPQQLAILNFWNDPLSVGNHAAHWNQIAVGLILRDHLGERRAVRVLERLNLALSDAVIACFDAKYTYWLIRPYQADPLITTPIGQPIHPSYPSLHSCQGGAAVGVLEHDFPLDLMSLRAMGREMNLSREWAGLHYDFDTEVGTEIGRKVAALAIASRKD
ncbi:MAG: vanadium-dependent haloperoxidase [Gemmatimonadota bacterium]